MIKIFVALVLALFCGCSPRQNKEAVVKINNYSMSAEDLVNELNSFSSFERAGKTNEELVDEIIEKKLLLLEAQREGLDREAAFMKMVERFWEQSLLRAIVEKKMKEFSAGTKRSDEKTRGKINKKFEEWSDSIRKKAKIYIDKAAFEKIKISSEE